jgi:hypothetical protein
MAPPDHAPSVPLFRLGLLEGAPGASPEAYLRAHEAMARLSALSGDSLRDRQDARPFRGRGGGARRRGPPGRLVPRAARMRPLPPRELSAFHKYGAANRVARSAGATSRPGAASPPREPSPAMPRKPRRRLSSLDHAAHGRRRTQRPRSGGVALRDSRRSNAGPPLYRGPDDLKRLRAGEGGGNPRRDRTVQARLARSARTRTP